MSISYPPCPWHEAPETRRDLSRASGPCPYCKTRIFEPCVRRTSGVTMIDVHTMRREQARRVFCTCTSRTVA